VCSLSTCFPTFCVTVLLSFAWCVCDCWINQLPLALFCLLSPFRGDWYSNYQRTTCIFLRGTLHVVAHYCCTHLSRMWWMDTLVKINLFGEPGKCWCAFWNRLIMKWNWTQSIGDVMRRHTFWRSALTFFCKLVVFNRPTTVHPLRWFICRRHSFSIWTSHFCLLQTFLLAYLHVSSCVASLSSSSSFALLLHWVLKIPFSHYFHCIPVFFKHV